MLSAASGKRLLGGICLLTLCLPQTMHADPLFTLTTLGSAVDSGSAEIPPGEVRLKGRAPAGDLTSDRALWAEGIQNGDFDVRIASVIPVIISGSGNMGVMARISREAGAPYVALCMTGDGRLVWRYRLSPGADAIEEAINAGQAQGLGLSRTGDAFRAWLKPTPDGAWQPLPMTLSLSFPGTLKVGLVLTGTADETNDVRFTGLSGWMPLPAITKPCAIYDFPFDDGRSPASLLFNPLRQTQLRTSETFVRTTTPGGSYQSSLLGVPMAPLSVAVDTQQIRFRLWAERSALPNLRALLVFGSQGVELRDRAKVMGGPIASGSGVIIGNDATMQGSLEAVGSLTLRDRAKVEGNVRVSGSVIRGNSTLITGTVVTGATVVLPALPETTFTTGNANITVNPDQTLELAPGSYGNVTVYSRAQVHFQPGVYKFASFWIDTDVKWHIHNTSFAGVEVFANTTFRLGDRDVVIPYDTSGGPILRVYTNQVGEMRMGTDLKLYGEFLAPKCNVILSSRTFSLKGGLYAKTVMLEPDAQINGSTSGIMTDTLRVTVQGSGGAPYIFEQHISGGSSAYKDKLRVKPPGGSWQEKTLLSSSPSQVWQTWDLRMVPAAKGREFRWLHDAGSGLIPALSGPGILGGDSLNGVTLEYLTQPGRLNRQIGFDDIRVGCLNPACAPITVAKQPSDTVVWEGGSAWIEMQANGTGLDYQWFEDGAVLSGESGPVLNLRKLDPGRSGHGFQCRVRSACDSVWGRTAILTVRACGTVAIWAQPQSSRVREGAAAAFKVNAGGVGHFTYAWYRNGFAVPGAVEESLSVSPVKISDHGAEYRVRVMDGCGQGELSDTAVLHVLADSACHLLSIHGPDTLPSGRLGAYEIHAACPGGSLRYSIDNQQGSVPASRGGVALVGPFTAQDSLPVTHRLTVHGRNAFGGDSLSKIITVVPSIAESRTVSITGVLKNQVGVLQDGLFAFEAQLYDREGGGTCLYRERFRTRLVPVIDGRYTLSLGTGESAESLGAVLRAHPHVFVDVQAGRHGILEPILSKLPLTAAPFVLRSQP